MYFVDVKTKNGATLTVPCYRISKIDVKDAIEKMSKILRQGYKWHSKIFTEVVRAGRSEEDLDLHVGFWAEMES